MKTKILISLAILMLMIGVSSCLIPSNKEWYLRNFEKFVDNVEKNAEEFKPRNWRYANRRYRLYSEKWYEKFRDELTLQEQIRVAGLKIRYTAAKQVSGARRLVDEQVKEDLDRIGRDIDKYLDENLDRDLEKISKGAKEIGDSAVKVLEDLLYEIRKKKDKGNNN
mgnify:CR=1 FL=1